MQFRQNKNSEKKSHEFKVGFYDVFFYKTMLLNAVLPKNEKKNSQAPPQSSISCQKIINCYDTAVF